jgi:hypothetical protein
MALFIASMVSSQWLERSADGVQVTQGPFESCVRDTRKQCSLRRESQPFCIRSSLSLVALFRCLQANDWRNNVHECRSA